MNNYHVYEEIGRGKNSIVYKGRKKKTIEYVAVKSTDKSRRSKVFNEVKILNNLNHQNILKFHNWYETRNHLWIIFEYCSGGDLMRLIEQDKALPENVIKSFGKDLVLGLQYLHSNGIIFCDLKPSNVLISEYGDLKLCDFGLSKKIIDMIQGVNQGGDNSKKGTPYYMAPELFQDGGVYSFYSDFWSLGCVLCELATGHPPFVATYFNELAKLILNGETPKFEKSSQAFNDLISELLQKDPTKRITWDRLRKHPFWGNYEIPTLKIPPQPHFESWLLLRKNSDEGSKELKAEKSSKSLREKEVNVLRLSQNIKKNILKELNQITYNEKVEKEEEKTDYLLINKDQEVDLGEENEECEEEENNENIGEQQDDSGQDEKLKKNNSDESLMKTTEKSQNNITTDEILARRTESKTTNRVVKPEKDDQNDKLSSVSGKSGNSLPNTPTTAAKPIKLTPIEQLLTHSSDTIVKPITGNREIEKIPDTTYLKENLPFTTYKLEDVVKNIETTQIENHFSDIYNYLSTNLLDKTPQNNQDDQLNALNYLETIILNSQVTNRLINCPFVGLLLKILKSTKRVQIKIRLISIIGYLIRHATVIDIEICSYSIPNLLIENLKDKNEKIKRRAMSALGEYLFYGATQLEEDLNTNAVWTISSISYNGVLRALKSDEDEIVKFYAVKTIENITSQAQTTGIKFSNNETLLLLISIYISTKNEGLKLSCSICLCNICRINVSLAQVCIEKLGFRSIIAFFGDGTPRIQQSFLSILNIYLFQQTKLPLSLMEEKNFIPSIISFLENTNIAIRGKSLLLIYLLLKLDIKILERLAETRFFSQIEKFYKDIYKYVQSCFQHLIVLFDELVPNVLKLVDSEFNKNLQSSNESSSHDINFSEKSKELQPLNVSNINSKNNIKSLYGNFNLLIPLFQICITTTFKLRYINMEFLETVFNFWEYSCNLNKISTQGNIISMLLLIYESIVSNPKILIMFNEAFLGSILPNLFAKLLNSQAEIRFNSFKIFSDITFQFLIDENFYESNLSTTSGNKNLKEFLTKTFIQNIKMILSDSNPMPLYGIKFLNELVKKDINFVSILRNMRFLNVIFDFFQFNNAKLSVATLELIARVVESKDVTLEELGAYNFTYNGIYNFKNFFALNQERNYEPMIDIFVNLHIKILESLKLLKINVNPIENMQNLIPLPNDLNINQYLNNYGNIFEVYERLMFLLNSDSMIIADKICNLLLILEYIFAFSAFNEKFMKTENLMGILNPLKNNNKSQIFKKVLKVLLWTITIYNLNKKIIFERKEMNTLIERLKNHEDKGVVLLIKEITKQMKENCEL